MKKSSKARLAALKKCISVRSKKIVVFLCAFLAFMSAAAITDNIICVATPADVTACKQELASYIASPSRYAINTNDYMLEIKNSVIKLSSSKNTSTCTAIFDKDLNAYTYSASANLTTAIFCFILLTIVFGIMQAFIFLAILASIKDGYTALKKYFKNIRQEYKISKQEAELKISHEDAETYKYSIELKEAYEKAQQNGYNDGYTKGRKHGYQRGQNDAYDEGYAKGYTAGQDELLESIHSFLEPQSDDKIYDTGIK